MPQISCGCLISSEFCVSSNLIGFISDLSSYVLNTSFSVELLLCLCNGHEFSNFICSSDWISFGRGCKYDSYIC